MAGPAGVPGFYDPKRAQKPGLGRATLDAGQVVPLTVSLPPGSSLARTNSELNGNYNEAKSQLAAAQASGDPAAIDKAQTNVYFRETQLNTFVKGQNDTTRSTIDEKNIVDPATRNANANTTTTTTTTATEVNRDDRAAPATSTTQTAQVNTIKLVPFDNILHEHSSYTYRLSLYALSDEEYNNLINDPTRTVDLKNLLIASGGAAQDKRSPYFKDDFYFDSMEMKTIFGGTATSRNTNVCEFNFKIIEPYGVSLIERLVKAVSELTKSNNYAQQPYMLTLDFWGYDDQALAPIKIEGCTRNFIINITKLEFSVTSKGAEYDISAQPYAHLAFGESASTISSNFEVSAKTVKEFFGDASDAAQANAKAATAGREDRAGTPPTTEVLYGSLGYVLTQNSKKLQEAGSIEIADEYIFKIDPAIANASILSADDKDIKGVPMKTEAFKKYAAAASKVTVTYENDKRKIAVAAGTTLINLINDIVIHSTYTLDQIIATDDKEAETLKASKPIQWLRIIPDIELIGFDKKRNTYAKRYTINLLEFSVFGHNHEQMGQAPVPGVAKIYDYFYTGQNKDVIDLKIEYNALYLQYLNSNRAIKAGSTPPANIDKNPDKTDTSTPPASAYPSQVGVSNSPALNSPSRASTNSNDLILNDVNNSMLSKIGTDMMTINMSIVGDPAYITQTDIFYGKFTSQFANTPVLPDRSLNPCLTEICALIRFNTPSDINLEKGIYDFAEKGDKEAIDSSFTGLYKVIEITSTLSGGKFIQNLNLMRMPEQTTNYVIESAAKNKFSKQDVGPENIKKLLESNNKIFGGLANNLLDLASSLAPVKNLLNGRNLV